MGTITATFLKLMRDESGATAIEYTFVAALVSIGLIVGATQMGQSINGFFESAAAGLKSK